MDTLQLSISTKIYDTKAITRAAYSFSDNYHIQINPLSEETIQVSVKTKENSNKELKIFPDLFFNELLDQQIRVSVEKDFGHIRDMIVKKAFSPMVDSIWWRRYSVLS